MEIYGEENIRIIQRSQHREIHIQITPGPEQSMQLLAEKIADRIGDFGAGIVRATFFGPLSEMDITLGLLREKLVAFDFPVSWIEGGKCTDAFINGVYIFAVSGIEINRLYGKNGIAGSRFQTPLADYCFLGGLYSDEGLSPALQTEQILSSARDLLYQAGFGFENTVRTWYYLDDILDWYDDFNEARTSFFSRHNIFNERIPASTGIGGRNPVGSKVCMELTAIKPRNSQFRIEKVISPLQCPAEKYGSSFSRAMLYSDGEYSCMTVSGTASLDAEGKTLHAGAIREQVGLTLEVVKAILDSRHFSFDGVVRAYAYSSDKRYYKIVKQKIENILPESFTCIFTENEVCRKELLFEIELDVIKKENPGVSAIRSANRS